jgi:hypothetical protein
MSLFDKHPLFVIEKLRDTLSKDVTLHFNRYFVSPQGTPTEDILYKTFSSPLFSITKEKVQSWIDSLQPNEEISLLSKVDKNLHLPQVDFYTTNVASMLDRFNYLGPQSFYVFDSGNSYHGYSPVLLNRREWENHLGKLLLLTPPKSEKPPIVDWRWVGHSLRRGYSALRWTNNSEKYIKVPEFYAFSRIKDDE